MSKSAAGEKRQQRAALQKGETSHENYAVFDFDRFHGFRTNTSKAAYTQ